jgi:hypothetical protein
MAESILPESWDVPPIFHRRLGGAQRDPAGAGTRALQPGLHYRDLTQRNPVCDRPVSGEVFIRTDGR